VVQATTDMWNQMSNGEPKSVVYDSKREILISSSFLKSDSKFNASYKYKLSS
jgi:hypothetical protein